MKAQRRQILKAMPMLGAIAAAAARAATTDLVVACDTTLGRSLRAVGRAFRARAGVTVHIFPTPPGLILPQLKREVQNDIVVTETHRLSSAADSRIIAAIPSGNHWRNRLVLAGRKDARSASMEGLTIAATDPTPACALDGPAVLSTAGLHPRAIIGAIDTDEVLDLITSGAAAVGLLHATDLAADNRLEVVAPIPDSTYAPIIYAAAVTRLARRPDPDAFVRFLASEDAAAILRAHRLERAS
jgi:molybdate transport system substrate-binding protein